MPNPEMTDPTSLKIGELAERAGTNPPTIRYYESVGLLPRAARQGGGSQGGQRRYGEADVRRLQLIRRCREFGFSVEQVRALVELADDPTRDCTEVMEIGAAHLDAVRAKLAELHALEHDIASFVDRCASSCAGRPGSSCVPLAQLGAGAGRAAGGAADGRPAARA